MEIMSFAEALAESESIPGARHLLLGNGFSISCRPDAFRYDRLFDEADFSRLSTDATELFGLTGTSDFEKVIEALRTATAVLDLYDPDQSTVLDRLRQDTDCLKEALAEVLSRKHPDNVGAIGASEYRACRGFLANFDGKIYTVNYDLLLYWTLLQDMPPEVQSDDGFRNDPDDEDAEWVLWDGFAGFKQRVYYLHGGLHLYDGGAGLKKITYSRTGVALVDQIRDALDKATYPVVVTEGSSAEKFARIERSPYLHRGLKSLNTCKGKLFVYGHSFDENDAHVLARIANGSFDAIFVSLYGDPASGANQAIQHRAQLLAERREEIEASKPAAKRRPLRVEFFCR